MIVPSSRSIAVRNEGLRRSQSPIRPAGGHAEQEIDREAEEQEDESEDE